MRWLLGLGDRYVELHSGLSSFLSSHSGGTASNEGFAVYLVLQLLDMAAGEQVVFQAATTAETRL